MNKKTVTETDIRTKLIMSALLEKQFAASDANLLSALVAEFTST